MYSLGAEVSKLTPSVVSTYVHKYFRDMAVSDRLPLATCTSYERHRYDGVAVVYIRARIC